MSYEHRLHDPAFPIPSWLYGTIGIHDVFNHRQLGPWYEFLCNDALYINGAVAEFGVFRGDSLITAALWLTRLGSDKVLHGFDTFMGLPSPHIYDSMCQFDSLFQSGRISRRHHDDVQLFRDIESSGLHHRHYFQDTNLPFVESRIKSFGLTNIHLHAGQFKHTIRNIDVRFSAILLDCDLYESYRDVLPYCWSHLSLGGMIYLDEYYSLKYPGPRIAVDEFCATISHKPEQIQNYSLPGEFERWCLRKPK